MPVVVVQNTGDTPENSQVQDQPDADLPFLQQAHLYIRSAVGVVQIAQFKLISRWVRPIEYSNQYDLLESTKTNFEKFRDLIDRTPQLPVEIALSHEMFRLKVNMALGQIKEAKLCIEDFSSPCTDIAQKFEKLLETLKDISRYCKLKM
jgi:hypothetical protein